MYKHEIIPLRVCEIDKFDQAQPLHACLPNANQTLCGFRVERKTHIPLATWGHDERAWCYRCQLAIKTYGHKIAERAHEPNVVSVLDSAVLRDVGKELGDNLVRDFCRRCASELEAEETGRNYCTDCEAHKTHGEIYSIAGSPTKPTEYSEAGDTPDYIEARIQKYMKAAESETEMFTEPINDCSC